MVQNLQPVGTVNWSKEAADPWHVAIQMNEDMENTIVVDVLFGEDRLVYPKEDGDWEFLAHFEEDESYFYDRTDEFAKQDSDYFIIDVPGKDGRFLFTERDD